MKKELWIAFAIATLLSGCSKDKDNVPGDNARVPLQVSGNIQTRAYDTTWEGGDAIGICMLNGSSTEELNKQYSTTGNGSFTATSEETIYFPVDGSARDLIAYYPYRKLSEPGADPKTYSIDVSTQVSQKAIDLMGSSLVPGKSSKDASVKFVFAHKLVKLDVSVEAGTGLEGTSLSDVSVDITGQHTVGTYDFVSGGGVVAGAGAVQDIRLLAVEAGKRYEGIVLPNGGTQDMKLRFSIPFLENQVFEWPLKDAKDSPKFNAGKKYKYTVTVNRTGVDITSEITPWEPGNGAGGETGSAE